MITAQFWLDKRYPKEVRESVKNLYLRGKELTGELDLREFISLEKLDCCFNQLTSLNLNGLKNLEVLYANDNLLTDLNYSDLDPGKLTGLIIDNNNLSQQNVSVFKNFVNLEDLRIGSDDREKINKGIYNRFYGSLESLKDLTRLQDLGINNTDINSGVEYLPSNVSVIRYSTTRVGNRLKDIAEELNTFLNQRISENWKFFHHNFTEQSEREWRYRGFSSHDVEKWIKVGLQPEEWELASYLRANNYNPILELNLTELRKEDRSAQKYLDRKYSESEKKWENWLDISRSGLVGGLVLENWTNLERLDCYNNKLANLTINNCISLTRIECISNIISNLTVNNCPEIAVLSVKINKLSNLTFLNNLNHEKLVILYLDNNNFAPQNLDIFRNFTNLKFLYLNDNNFFGSLQPLQNLTKLERLGISGNEINDGLEYLSNSCKEISCRGKMYGDLVLYGNNLTVWQEAHSHLMKTFANQSTANYYGQVEPEVLTTKPKYLNEKLSSDTISVTSHDLFDLDYSKFILRDGRPFSWETQSESKFLISDKMPLRLYDLSRDKVELTEVNKVTDYIIISYCWGTEWEKTPQSYGQVYQTDLTKLGRKALNKVKAFYQSHKEAGVPAHIWIDNFCINQTDTAEKGVEVRNQKQYYSKAVATLVSIDSSIGKIEGRNELEFTKHVTREIMSSQWFERSWTFQEGFLSKQTIFMFDDCLVDGRILSQSWGALQNEIVNSYSLSLNKNLRIFITPLGWSYGKNEKQKVNLGLIQSLYSVKDRQQTVQIDGIYSILGLLPYGEKVKSQYKPSGQVYNQEDLEKALLEIMKIAVQEGNYQEIFAWQGSRRNEPELWLIPRVKDNGSVDIRRVIDSVGYQPKNIELTSNGINLIGFKFVIDFIRPRNDDKLWVQENQKVFQLKGIVENLDKIKSGDALVIPEEQNGDKKFAILIPNNENDSIDTVEFSIIPSSDNVYSSLKVQKLFIDIVKKEVISDKIETDYFLDLNKWI
ncbi:MAG: hypothetical protein AD073_000249 [Mycoplasmataceae bacterium]|nr:MAG: hypothetical protein AD073_000249 [Mycoplasmataceae bacterium]